MKEVPQFWLDFIESSNLIEKEIDIPESDDSSKLGACFKILNNKQILEEANESYPGIIVSQDGYLPVGCCLEGSGDPYFVNINEGPKGKLYRIYHDSVLDNNYNSIEAIDVIVDDYERIIDYID
jgi:hypothetical protein